MVSIEEQQTENMTITLSTDLAKFVREECGENVYREKMPSCIDWCASARQCLGEERWKELKGED